MSEMSIDVGLLYRRQFRRFLEEAQWDHQVGEWKELKGFLTSTFLIRSATPQLIAGINAWIAAVNERRT